MEQTYYLKKSATHIYNAILIGGTFDTLHIGHKAYIKRAFQIAEKVFIQLSSDTYPALFKKNYKVKPFHQRLMQLIAFIRSLGFDKSYVVYCLNSIKDLESFCIHNNEIEAVLAITDYIELFKKYNELRWKKLKPKYQILEMELIKDKNGEKISSTMVNGTNRIVLLSKILRLRNILRYESYPILK